VIRNRDRFIWALSWARGLDRGNSISEAISHTV